jgi:hypothetical protein
VAYWSLYRGIFFKRVRRTMGNPNQGNKCAVIQSYINGSTDFRWALSAFSVSYFYSEPAGCHSGEQALHKAAFPLFRDIFA